MGRKIGEIFEYNGEWYQCIGNPYNECTDCDFCFETGKACVRQIVGQCSMSNRSDGLSVVFKRLEKVGEPYEFDGHLFQSYRTFEVPIFTENYATVRELGNNSKISIEIKQNKEDMEDLDKIKVRDYTKVEELNVMEEKKLNLKPFDIQKAREGKPVCTRDGRKARIICFDVKAKKPIAALITNDDTEEAHFYYDNGRSDQYQEYRYDLMMLPEKKEGWVNVYNSLGVITFSHNPYDTKEEALASEMEDPILNKYYVDTVKVEWEE